MGDPLRPLWDFDDLESTEQRFRAALQREEDEVSRAEILTQLARIEALCGRFEAADELLDQAEGPAASEGLAHARLELERGRVRRSSGDRAAAYELFVSAFDGARLAGNGFMTADAAHMAALAAPDRDGMVAWTQRGIELAEASPEPEVRYWLGPLLNNLGWDYYEAGEYDAALEAFERALAARERDAERPGEREIARYAVGKTLRAAGRPGEAAVALEQAIAWTVATDEPDGWFHEELAEDYAALGRDEDAAEQARLALALLPDADASFESDGARHDRLLLLARAAPGA